MTNIEILQFNAILYVGTLLIYTYKKRALDLGFVCLFMFSVASVGSIVYYSFPGVEKYYPNIRVEPLLYTYVLYLFAVLPILFLKTKSIKNFNIKFQFLNFFSYTFIIASIPVFFNLVVDLLFGNFAGNYFSMMYENDTDNSKLLLFPLIQPFYAVIRRFFDIIVVLFILNIIKGNTKNAFLLLFSIGVFFLMPLLSGSRGGVVINSIKIVGYYLLLSGLLSKKIKKTFRTFGFLFLIILIVVFALISISRFSNMDTGDRVIQQWISQYVGEGFVRFSDTIWDLKRTLDGNKNFPFFKSLLGYDVILDNDRAIDVYSAYIGAKTNVFYTFIGSFYLDFGRLGNIIWFILLGGLSYLIINRINKTNTINFIEIFYIVYLYNLCAMGFTANPYAISHTQKDITVQFILIGVIYILSKRKGVIHLQTP